MKSTEEMTVEKGLNILESIDRINDNRLMLAEGYLMNDFRPEIRFAFRGEKSDIRWKIEEFEKTLSDKWGETYKQYNVNHCYRLPKDVYYKVIKDFIAKPITELIFYFSERATLFRHTPASCNPYVLAVAALRAKYKWDIAK